MTNETLNKSSFPRKWESSLLKYLGSRFRGNDKTILVQRFPNELPINCASALLAGERAYLPSPSGESLRGGRSRVGVLFPFTINPLGCTNERA